MPTGVIKGSESEAIWARAVKTTEEQYPGLKGKDKNKFYKPYFYRPYFAKYKF